MINMIYIVQKFYYRSDGNYNTEILKVFDELIKATTFISSQEDCDNIRYNVIEMNVE